MAPNTPVSNKALLAYPKTRIAEITEEHFGITVGDNYRWLEDGETAEVRKWDKAQDEFARKYLAMLPNRDVLRKRFGELSKMGEMDVPLKRGGRLFFRKREGTQQKKMLFYKNPKTGIEKILIDPAKLCVEGEASLVRWIPSRDGKKVAYVSVFHETGAFTLNTIDVSTGVVDKTDQIDGARFAVPEWNLKGDGFYYTWLPTDPSIPRPDRLKYAEIRFHKLGTDPKKDRVVFEKTNEPETLLMSRLSYDGKWLFIYVNHGFASVDVYYRRADKLNSPLKLFYKGTDQAFVMPWKGYFYIWTNDGSPKWRIDKTREDQPNKRYWKTIIPERDNTVIEDMDIVGGNFVLRVLQNASGHVEIRNLDGNLIRNAWTPAIGNTTQIKGSPYDDEAYYGFDSFTIPPQIYKMSMSTSRVQLLSQVQTPVDSSPYIVNQEWYPSKDGTPISMFVVHRKGMKLDGSIPFILTGYGGFGQSLNPSFTPTIYPWLEAGGGYAVANLRGGGEYGEDWHRGGVRDKKQNVFDDFIAGAEYLIRQGYTRPARLAITGESNGGLLVGAALTQRPDLFGAAVCRVPVLDMLRYHLFGNVGKTMIPEYGSPDNETDFRSLAAYSPYHHVKVGAPYPAALFMASGDDNEVDPMHARKMAAILQEASPNGKPVLLRIEANADHSGANSLDAATESNVDEYSFLMNEIGVR